MGTEKMEIPCGSVKNIKTFEIKTLKYMVS